MIGKRGRIRRTCRILVRDGWKTTVQCIQSPLRKEEVVRSHKRLAMGPMKLLGNNTMEMFLQLLRDAVEERWESRCLMTFSWSL